MLHHSSDQHSITESSYIFDSESSFEMARLTHQGQLLTQAMGGVLPGIEQARIAQWQQVLDIGCGPGEWVLNVAFEQPHIEVAGIDVSRLMVDYANARARTQKLPNVSFGVMDVLQPLDFSTDSFDLVNGRFLIGFLSKANWQKLLGECTRILRPGGVLRLTETDWLGPTTSLAFEQLTALSAQFYARQPGNRSFSPDARTYGITPMLAGFLRDLGYQNIHSKAHAIDFSAGAAGWTDLYRNAEIVFQLIKEPLISYGLITPEEFDRLFQQMQIDAHSNSFRGIWYFLTVWGEKTATAP